MPLESCQKYTATLSEILALTPVVQTIADATDVPGVRLEWLNGAWYGDCGFPSAAQHSALLAANAYSSLGVGSRATLPSGPVTWRGASAGGWGESYYDPAGFLRPQDKRALVKPFKIEALNTALLAASKLSTGTFTIACVGESTTMGTDAIGSGLTSAYVGSWPWHLAKSLRKNGYHVSESSCFSSNDAARVVRSGFTEMNVGYGHRSSSSLLSTVSGSTIVVSPNLDYEWDACRITHYKSTTRTGTADVSATGGSTTSINGNGAINSYESIIVYAAKASRDNQIFVNVTANGGVALTTYECFNSRSGFRFRVLNCGSSSSGVLDWSKNQNSVLGTALVARESPNLTLICLGGNDSTNSMAPDTYFASYSTIVSRLKSASSFVGLLPITTRKNEAAKLLVDQYVTKQSTLADATVIDYGPDLWARWRDLDLPAWDNNVHLVSMSYRVISDMIQDVILN